MVISVVHVVNGGDQIALSYLLRKCQSDGLIREKKMSMRFINNIEMRKIKAKDAMKRRVKFKRMMRKHAENN